MECDAKELAKALTRARDFLGSSLSNPALKCFRFEGRFVEAADYDLAAKLNLPEGLDFKAPVLVPGAECQAIVAKLSGRVTVEADEKAVRIADGGSKFRLATMASGGFPAFPAEPAKYAPAPLVCQAVKAVKAFAGDPKRTQIYAGVRIDDDQVIAGDEKFRALCVARMPAQTGIQAIVGMSFANLFATSAEDTELGCDGRRLFLRSADGVVCGPTIEGRYADYRKATAGYQLPDVFTFKHQDLKEAIEKIVVLAKDDPTEETGITRAIFTFGEGRMTLASSVGAHEARAELAAQGSGSGCLHLNVALISNWVRSAKCDSVTMSCNIRSPRVIRFTGQAELSDGRAMDLTVYVCPMIPAAKEKPGEEKD
ncbi:MAG: hypothetical protein ABFE07_29290 [Armatimonadia bacterium]